MKAKRAGDLIPIDHMRVNFKQGFQAKAFKATYQPVLVTAKADLGTRVLELARRATGQRSGGSYLGRWRAQQTESRTGKAVCPGHHWRERARRETFSSH